MSALPPTCTPPILDRDARSWTYLAYGQASVYKGRSRDSAWYSVLDGEWPAIARAFTTWLDPTNFDEAGHQRISLRALTRPLLAPATAGT